MSIRKPTIHSMNRRSYHCDYSRPGIYHITLKVAEALRHPFGRVVGNIDKTDGDPDAPRVELSPIKAHHYIISKNGRTMNLGQVIAGYKKGCNKRYWEMTGQQPLFSDSFTDVIALNEEQLQQSREHC